MSAPYLIISFNPLKDFLKILVKCPSRLRNVQDPESSTPTLLYVQDPESGIPALRDVQNPESCTPTLFYVQNPESGMRALRYMQNPDSNMTRKILSIKQRIYRC